MSDERADRDVQDDGDGRGASKTDFRLGVSVAMIAATVAVLDIFAGRVGSAQLLDVEEKVAAYQWFNAKGLKETVAEGRSATLHALLEGGAIADDRRAAVQHAISEADADAARYAGEKRVLLEGGVLDGKPVMGARALEARALHESDVGDILDVAKLFLNLGLLLGGVGIAVAHKRLERALLRIVVTLGLLGVALGVAGAWWW